MNGYGVLNYENVPKGWDHFDGLVSGSDYSSGGVVQKADELSASWTRTHMFTTPPYSQPMVS